MDTATQSTSQLTFRLQRFAVLAWHALRAPKLTGVLLAILAVVVILRLILPQQTPLRITAATWTTTLPSPVQPWGELLFFLGFSNIFQSIWFWFPLALLVLNSLVALAAYIFPSWQRARPLKENADIRWQHPLAQRTERSVRLPEAPDAFLDALKETLKASGFLIESSFEADQRVVSAARNRWTWLAVVTFYGGLILLGGAFLVSHYSLKTEPLVLFPLTAETSRLFDGSFELAEIDAGGRSGSVIFRSHSNEQSAKTIRWRLYQPLLLEGTVILPLAVGPVLTIEAQDTATGELRRLMPVQEDLSPDTRLNLPLNQSDEPLYFLIPSASLAFQILPVSNSGENRYNVQVRRGSESSPSENLTVEPGETFEVDDLSVSVFLNYNVQFVARRDWALPIYGVSLVVIVLSGLLLYFRPAWQVWLIPEVKGRGGQLYGVVEKLGTAKESAEFLERLLPKEESTENVPEK